MNDLIIENLSVSYRRSGDAAGSASPSSSNRILHNFSLHVRSGDLVVILGPSGCGKSTLLTAISGLKKPDKGRINFNNSCFFSKADHINIPAEQRNIGFVFQSYALWPHMSVAQNIAFPLKARKYSRTQIHQSVSHILDTVHMNGYAHRYPGELSGGEKQRIALARSLVYHPLLLLLDEPLANIDANLKTSLIREIKETQRKLGITTIYVTHDQSEAFEIADHIVIMNDGIIMQQGSPREIYHHSKNLFVADFIGKNNIFQTHGHGCPRFLKHCRAKQAVAVRPEDIEIKSDGVQHGVIKSVLYKGDRTEYIIESGGVELLAYMPSDEKRDKGDRVSFDIKRYHSI